MAQLPYRNITRDEIQGLTVQRVKGKRTKTLISSARGLLLLPLAKGLSEIRRQLSGTSRR